MTQLLHTGAQQLRQPPHHLHEKKRIKISSMGKIRVPNAHPSWGFSGGQWLLRKRMLLILDGFIYLYVAQALWDVKCMPIGKALPRPSYFFVFSWATLSGHPKPNKLYFLCALFCSFILAFVFWFCVWFCFVSFSFLFLRVSGREHEVVWVERWRISGKRCMREKHDKICCMKTWVSS